MTPGDPDQGSAVRQRSVAGREYQPLKGSFRSRVLVAVARRRSREAGVAAVRPGARRWWQSEDMGCGDPTAQCGVVWCGVVECREGE